jgi:nitroreductase
MNVTHNPTIETLMNRKSIRAYHDEEVGDDVIEAIVRAGQQAPFAYQLCSLLLSRKREKNPFGAPLLFTICVDSHRLEVVMAQRDWQMIQSDVSLLLFGIQDASLMAQNMVIAAESLGLGSCFLGGAPYRAEAIIREYNLPKRVFPLVQLAMGHPAEDPPTRPRYPIDFTLFESEYPEFSYELIRRSMAEMDMGYLAQDYYRKAGYQIPLEGEREETYTFEDYSWTEHISRKVGQWHPSPEDLLEPLAKCGFRIAID